MPQMNIPRRLLDTIQRRFQRSRPGSVMILVVTLLVLMALIGTAYISTARTDRYSSAAHAINTQIDMILDGVAQMTVSAITPRSIQQPAFTTDLPRQAPPSDDPISDNWLAARTPVRMVDAVGDWDGFRAYSEGEWVRVPAKSAVPPFHQFDFYVSLADGNTAKDPTNAANSSFWLLDASKLDTTPVWESVTTALATGGITEDSNPAANGPIPFD